MASPIHIVRKRGDTQRITFCVKAANNTPIDITGWTNFSMAVNKEQKPVNTDNQVEIQSGTILDATAGKVFFPVSGTIPVGSYYFDMQATDDNSEIVTLVEGKYSITQDITKS